MTETVRNLNPAQSLLFWLMMTMIGLLLVMVVVDVAKLLAEIRKVALQGDTLEAIRDLVKAHSQVNEYTIKKTRDVGAKAEEVKQAVSDVVSKLVADAPPSGLSIPAVRGDSSQGDRP